MSVIDFICQLTSIKYAHDGHFTIPCWSLKCQACRQFQRSLIK